MKKVRMSLSIPDQIYKALTAEKKASAVTTSVTRLILDAVAEKYGIGKAS